METMKVMKNIVTVFSVVNSGVVLPRNPSALPSGSLDGAKSGSYNTYSDGDGLNVKVVFNVYDKCSGKFTWGGQVNMPAADKYIYVHHLFNYSDSKSLSTFNVLNSDKSDVASVLYAAKRGRKRQAV